MTHTKNHTYKRQLSNTVFFIPWHKDQTYFLSYCFPDFKFVVTKETEHQESSRDFSHPSHIFIRIIELGCFLILFFPKIFWKKLIAISRSWSFLLQSFFWSSHIPTTSHKRNCWKLEQDGPSGMRSTWSKNRPTWTICYLSVSKGGVWRYFWTSSNFNQGSASLFPVTQTSLFLSYFSSTAYFPPMLSLP